MNNIGIIDVLKDKVVRTWLLVSLLVALILIAPSLWRDGVELRLLIDYLREVGFAVLVALPIMLTIELFNQRRHQKLEDGKLREQAIALVRRGVPESVWASIDESVIEASFFRDRYKVKYVLTLIHDDTGEPDYVEVVTTHSFRIHRMRDGRDVPDLAPSIALSGQARGKAAFIEYRAGAVSKRQAELLAMTQEVDGNLVLTGLPPVTVDMKDNIEVVLEIRTAYGLTSPFEAVVTMMPAEGLTVRVEASERLIVDVDALHSKDMVERLGLPPNTYEWVQEAGLVAGQGAVLRWKLADAQD